MKGVLTSRGVLASQRDVSHSQGASSEGVPSLHFRDLCVRHRTPLLLEPLLSLSGVTHWSLIPCFRTLHILWLSAT